MTESARQQFFVTLFNTRNRIRFAMDEAFKPLGITDATWRTLFYLEQTGSGVSQKELANVMGIEGPSLVRLLDSLADKQLIERRPSQEDRRAKTVHLTARARELLVELHEVSNRVREDLLRDVDPDQLRICMDVFATILGVLDNRESK